MNLLKNFAKFSIGTWINVILGLITTPIIAWLLSPQEFGKSSMFSLTYNLLLNLVLLSADQGLARYFNDHKEDISSLLKHSLLPVLGTMTVCCTVLYLFHSSISTLLFSASGEILGIHILVITLFSGLLLRLAVVLLRMQNKAIRYSIVQITQGVVNFMVTLFYAKFIKADFYAILVALMFSQIVSLIVVVILDWDVWVAFFSQGWGFNKIQMKSLLAYNLPFVPTFILSWLFEGVDRTFLRYFSNFSQLGIYATANKISLSLGILQIGFTTFWLPYSLNHYNKHPEVVRPFKIVFNALVFAFCTVILSIVLLQDVLLIILPKSYNAIIPVYPPLLMIPMLYTLSEITMVGINFKVKTVYHIYIIIYSLLSNSIAAYFFVPLWGAKGAAIAMFIGYMVFFAARTYYGSKTYPVSYDIKKFLIALILLCIPIFITVFFNNHLYLVGFIFLPVFWVLYKKDFYLIKLL